MFRLELPPQLQDGITLALSVIIEALPFVLLGILLSVIVQVWIPQKWINALLSSRLPGPMRRLVASFLGVFLPVCECGNLPLARGFLMKGFTPAETITFLLAAPIINPITIITTQQAFPDDPVILAARLVGGLAIANIVGWIFAKRRTDDMLTPSFAKACAVPHAHAHNLKGKMQESLSTLRNESNSIMPALFVGGFIAAAVQVTVPRETLTMLGADPLLSVFAMIALAFIISICASVDAFFALAFASTFTPGALVSFLTFGPVVDIKMLNLMHTTYRKQVLVTTAVVAFGVSAIVGLGVNYAF